MYEMKCHSFIEISENLAAAAKTSTRRHCELFYKCQNVVYDKYFYAHCKSSNRLQNLYLDFLAQLLLDTL